MKKSNRQGEAGDYDVGYGKPPKHTRFKPGQSGNPNGRPKGTKNLKTDLSEELGEKILVREGDRARHVSKQRAMVKALMARSLKGDTRAASLLISMMMRLLDTGDAADTHAEPLDENELETLRMFEAQVRQEVAEAIAAADEGDAREITES